MYEVRVYRDDALVDCYGEFDDIATAVEWAIVLGCDLSAADLHPRGEVFVVDLGTGEMRAAA